MALRYLDQAPDVLASLAHVEVLYTDLDGTLLGRGASVLRDDTGAPTLDTARAIVDVNIAGLTVVMVSGRNFIQLAEDSRLLGWTDFIGEVGALRSTGRERRVEYMLGDWPEDAVPEGITPYEAILEAGALDMLMTAFPGRIERHVPWDSDRVVTFILRGEVEIEEAQAVLDQIELPVQIVDNGVIHPVNHGLRGVEQIHAYHLVPKGTSKVRAIRYDLESRGLRPEQAAAIGDSRADLDMAEAVGVMVLVANGLDVPAVRDAARRYPQRGRDPQTPGTRLGGVRRRVADGSGAQGLTTGRPPASGPRRYSPCEAGFWNPAATRPTAASDASGTAVRGWCRIAATAAITSATTETITSRRRLRFTSQVLRGSGDTHSSAARGVPLATQMSPATRRSGADASATRRVVPGVVAYCCVPRTRSCTTTIASPRCSRSACTSSVGSSAIRRFASAAVI